MMERRKQFGEGIFFVLTNYVYALLMTNIYFVLCNSIFLFFFMTLRPSFSNIVIYFLALIPTGPAISALFYSMRKLVREKELSPIKDFFHGYRQNVKDTMKFWLPLLLILFILFVDLQYFNEQASVFDHLLFVVFLLGIILLVSLSLYVFSINAHFTFRTRDLFRLSIYFIFKKVKITFGNIAIMIITVFAISISTNFLPLICSSLVCFLLTLNIRGVIEEVRLKFTKDLGNEF